MKIAVVSPAAPRFDATLHYWMAEFAAVVAYLHLRFPHAEVLAEPAGLINKPDKVVVRLLLQQPDFLLLWVRVWEAAAARKLAELARRISPRTRILLWGDAGLFMPQYFTRSPFDGVVVSGDAELVLADAMANWASGQVPDHGMRYLAGERWLEAGRGRWLDAALWPFPDLSVVLFGDVQRARELRGKRTDDLSFDVSRGCQVGCSWCVDPLKGGPRDRRRPVPITVDYMTTNLGEFAQFQCHGPIFTNDRGWIADFIGELRRRGQRVPFKAVTLAKHLEDEAMVAGLAEVGMTAVGFGVETLTADRRRLKLATPKMHAVNLEEAARVLRRHGVEGKAYTQIGLANQGRADILFTHRTLIDLGFTVRPTGATPFERLRHRTVEELDRMDLAAWDRKSYFDPACGLSYHEFYQLITQPEHSSPET